MKLRTECGQQFTSKLEGMFRDMRTSEDCMTSFRKEIDAGRVAELPFDLNVQVCPMGKRFFFGLNWLEIVFMCAHLLAWGVLKIIGADNWELARASWIQGILKP